MDLASHALIDQTLDTAMRTLIIGNHIDMRTTIKMMLMGLAECDEAPDAETGLNVFNQAAASGMPFDLVVLDFPQPHADGMALLNELRKAEANFRTISKKEVCIFVVTDMIERQLEIDCLMHGCNDVICKPVDTKHLVQRLNRFQLLARPEAPSADEAAILSTKKILDTISRKLKRGALQLPPAPKIAMRIRQLFTCNAEIDEVIGLLKQDLSIRTKLISISNSAFYRGVKKSTSLSQAVRRLGIDRTVEVVMSICCRGFFVTNHPGYKKLVEDLWWHSLACAHTMEFVAHLHKLESEADLFSLGLLHDIGKLMLIQVAGDLERPRKDQMDIRIEDLKSMMGAHHRRFGSALLRKWGYDEAFISLIRQPGQKKEPDSDEAGMLHRANLLARFAGYGMGPEPTVELVGSLEQLGYGDQARSNLKAQIQHRMEQLRYEFG